MPRHTAPLVYLAGRYSRRDELNGYATQLRELGVGRVDARWLTGEHDWDGSQATGAELAVGQQFALDDLHDLERAHAVVVFTEQVPDVAALILEALGQPNTEAQAAAQVAERLGRNRGGRHVEYGLALALQKHLLVVGPAENVFHSLPSVPRFTDWVGALAHLVTWKDATESAAVRQRLMLP